MIGHSLGSLILFDLLSHQIRDDSISSSDDMNKKETSSLSATQNDESLQFKSESLYDYLKRLNLTEYQAIFEAEKIESKSLVSLLVLI